MASTSKTILFPYTNTQRGYPTQNLEKLAASDPLRKAFIIGIKSSKDFFPGRHRGTAEELIEKYKGRATDDHWMRGRTRGLVFGVGEIACKGDGQTELPAELKVLRLRADNMPASTSFDNALLGVRDNCEDLDDSKSPTGRLNFLRSLARRYVEDYNIYTNIGDTVICMNPYMYLPKMMDMDKYKAGDKISSTFAVAERAYKGLQGGNNQTIMVSGSPGSGKTIQKRNSCLRYLQKLSDGASASGKDAAMASDTKSVARKIDECRAFLEPFICASTKTSDNHRQSVAKTKIYFKDGKIIGGDVDHYCFDTGLNYRPPLPWKHGRHFHIFYMLIRGSTAEEKTRFSLGKVEDYKILTNGGKTEIGHKWGAEEYESKMNAPLSSDPDDTGLRAAFTCAGVSDVKQAAIFSVVAALLHLGNVEFRRTAKGGKVKKKSQKPLKIAEQLLGVKLEEVLLKSKITICGRVIRKCNSNEEAALFLSGLMNLLYLKLFEHLNEDIADPLYAPKVAADGFIAFVETPDVVAEAGEADMSSLLVNTLCEKMESTRRTMAFENMKAQMDEAGVSIDDFPDPTNYPTSSSKPVLDLLLNRRMGGIFPIMLDNLHRRKEDNNLELVNSLVKNFGGKKWKTKRDKKARQYFSKPSGKKDGTSEYIFAVDHFFGRVSYCAKGFFEANLHNHADYLAAQTFAISSKPFVQGLFRGTLDKTKRVRPRSPVESIIKEMDVLIREIEATELHNILCIKPNNYHLKPIDGEASVDYELIHHQLKAVGAYWLLDTVAKGRRAIEKAKAQAAPASNQATAKRMSFKERQLQKLQASLDAKEKRTGKQH